MTIYVFVQSKGGVGKTASAAELIWILAHDLGRRVLGIDLDFHASLSTRMGQTKWKQAPLTVLDVLTGHASIPEAIMPAPHVPGADVLVPSAAMGSMKPIPKVATILRERLATDLSPQWDDAVIDCHPDESELTLAGIVAADRVIAPTPMNGEGFQALPTTISFVEERAGRTGLHPGQSVHHILPTMFQSRGSLDQLVMASMHDRYPGRVTSPIRQAKAVQNAYTSAMPVGAYAPKSPVVQDYRTAFESVIVL